jgi:hypothetical protein
MNYVTNFFIEPLLKRLRTAEPDGYSDERVDGDALGTDYAAPVAEDGPNKESVQLPKNGGPSCRCKCICCLSSRRKHCAGEANVCSTVCVTGCEPAGRVQSSSADAMEAQELSAREREIPFGGAGSSASAAEEADGDDAEMFWDEEFAATLAFSKVAVKGGLLPSPRCWSAVCAADKNIVLMGGYDKSTPYPDDMHVFDTTTGVWSRKFPSGKLPSARYAHSLNFVGDKFFIFGGDSLTGYLNDVYVLDKDLTVCTQADVAGHPPHPRAAPATAVVGRDVYFFGGDSGVHGGYCNDMFVFCTSKQTLRWEQIPIPQSRLTPWPEARGWQTMSTVGNKLYMFGGYNGTKPYNELWVFDVASRTWEQPEVHGQSPSARYSHTAVVVGGKFLMIVGGHDNRETHSDVFVFNTETNSWIQPTISGDLPPPRHGHSATVIMPSENVYLFGGFNTQDVFDHFSVISMESKPSIKVPESDLAGDLSTLVNSKAFSDVVFAFDNGTNLYAHKAILASRSRYFNAMFTSFKEKTQDVIAVSDVPQSVFLRVLEFLYKGTVVVPNKEVIATLKAAIMYDLTGLSRLCESMLETTMDVKNAGSLFDLADSLHAVALRKSCTRFISANYGLVELSPSFRELSAAQQEHLRAAAKECGYQGNQKSSNGADAEGSSSSSSSSSGSDECSQWYEDGESAGAKRKRK